MQKNLFTQDQVCHSNLAEIEIELKALKFNDLSAFFIV